MLKLLRNNLKSNSNFLKRNYNKLYKKSTVELENGLSYAFESGRMARFADGSVVLTQGENALLATTVKKKSSSNQSFLPLTTEYRSNAAAIGKIPSTYLRKELFNADVDILIARCVDRSLRPLFMPDYDNDIQIVCKPIAFDDDCDPTVLSINCSSASAYCANLPFVAPVGAVRIALVDGKIIINPNKYQKKNSLIDLLLTGTENNKIVMLEMEGKEVSKDVFQECIKQGLIYIGKIIESIKELNPDFVPYDPHTYKLPDVDKELQEAIRNLAENELAYIYTDITLDKEERDKKVVSILSNILNDLAKEFLMPDFNILVSKNFYSVAKDILRNETILSKNRMDGRALDEIRPISMEVNPFEKLHGSAIFQRGQSQVLSTVTFDAPEAAFRPDSISQLFGLQEEKKFMHHYEFPAYATNDIKTIGKQNRREIGHGMLAEKALKNMIPHDFPYSIRLNTQVLESNGSTSMAAVVGGTLALRDAGVNMKSPVAGIAMGLMTTNYSSESEDSIIMTDINGLEDYAGDMDFKIAGTKNGFTSMQLDIKIPGLSLDLLNSALNQSIKGLNFLLNEMLIVQPNVRSEFKKTVPVLEEINIPIKVKINLFQNGRYNCNLIECETGVKIKQEDDFKLRLLAPNKTRLEEAKKMIFDLKDTDKNATLEFGGIYEVEIVEIIKSGFMIQFQKGTKPVFIKNSDIGGGMAKIADSSVFQKNLGDKIRIRYFGDDPNTGKLRLSGIMVKKN